MKILMILALLMTAVGIALADVVLAALGLVALANAGAYFLGLRYPVQPIRA